MRLFAFSAAALLASYLVAKPNYWILLLLPIAVFAAYFNGLHSAGECVPSRLIRPTSSSL